MIDHVTRSNCEYICGDSLTTLMASRLDALAASEV